MESKNMEKWQGSLIKKTGSETTKAMPIESPKKSKRTASPFIKERKSRRLQMDKELLEPIAEELEENSVIELPSMPVLAEADSMQDKFLEMRVKRKSKKSKKSKKHSKRNKTPDDGQLDEVIDPIDTKAEIVEGDTKAEVDVDANAQQLEDIVINQLISVSNSLDEKRKRRHHHHHHHQHLQNNEHHHHHHHRHKHHHHHHRHHHGNDITMSGNLVHTTLPSSSSTFFSTTTTANNSNSPACFNQKKRILEQWRREHSQPLQEKQEQQEREQQQQLPSDSD